MHQSFHFGDRAKQTAPVSVDDVKEQFTRNLSQVARRRKMLWLLSPQLRTLLSVIGCGVTRTKARWFLLGAALALGLLVALNWQGVMLALAMTSNETRPSLLADAEWNEPQSAVEFNKRFHAGLPESDLLTWLQANRFAIDRRNRSAIRTVKALPCNEAIEINWSTFSDGALDETRAMVKEAGCL